MAYPEDFEELWKFLGSCGAEGLEWRKGSVKKSAFNRWKNLKPQEKADAIRGIPLFIAQVKDHRKVFPQRQFCMFDVYLNQARWENLIDIENEHLATLAKAQDVAAKREREKPQQLPLALVVPLDERRAKLAAAHSQLIKQNEAIIRPVVNECDDLFKQRPVVAYRKWADFRKNLPYLPETWKEVRFG